MNGDVKNMMTGMEGELLGGNKIEYRAVRLFVFIATATGTTGKE